MTDVRPEEGRAIRRRRYILRDTNDDYLRGTNEKKNDTILLYTFRNGVKLVMFVPYIKAIIVYYFQLKRSSCEKNK